MPCSLIELHCRNTATICGYLHPASSQEFAEHGMSNVTLTHRNVCKDGFTIVNTADAGNHSQILPFLSPRTEGRWALRDDSQ